MPNLVPWVKQYLHSYYHGKNQNYFGLLLNVRTVCLQRLNPQFRFNIFLVLGKSSVRALPEERPLWPVWGKLNQGALQNIQTCQNFWNGWDDPRNLKADQSTRLKTGRSLQKNWIYLAKKKTNKKYFSTMKDISWKWEALAFLGRSNSTLEHATHIH
jgi:hypothetical protein